MSINTIRTSTVIVLTLLALSISSTSLAQQVRNMRGQNNSSNQENFRPQTSTENEQALRKIEMINEVNRERREQRNQQEKMLQELRSLIMQEQGDEYYPTSSGSTPQSTERVTSGSVLSQIDFQEREELKQLEQQYHADLQNADREIDFLRQQLEIANQQLDQCQTTTTTNSRNHSLPQVYEPAQASKKTVKAKKVKQSAKSVQKQDFIFDDVPQQQVQPKASEADLKAMREIEEINEANRIRRQQYEAQRKMLDELERQITSR